MPRSTRGCPRAGARSHFVPRHSLRISAGPGLVRRRRAGRGEGSDAPSHVCTDGDRTQSELILDRRSDVHVRRNLDLTRRLSRRPIHVLGGHGSLHPVAAKLNAASGDSGRGDNPSCRSDNLRRWHQVAAVVQIHVPQSFASLRIDSTPRNRSHGWPRSRRVGALRMARRQRTR